MKVLIVENNPIYRYGLVSILQHEFPAFEIEQSDDKNAMLKNCKHYEMIIINQDQFALSETEIKRIEKNALLLSSDTGKKPSHCCKVLKPDCDCQNIVQSVKALIPDIKQHQLEALSDREKEILIFVAKGKTNKEIAEILYLSPHTIHTHRKNILRKLDLRSAAELTIYAIREGIMDWKR